MTAEILVSLIDAPLVLETDGPLPPFIAGDRFRLRVSVTSYAKGALAWTAGKPLTMSYRWFDNDGNVIDVPDQRTVLPTSNLVPHVPTSILVAGLCPATEGSYLLQLSLILEDVHWAADVSNSGWLKLSIPVRTAVKWPNSLKTSVAGKALRGALVSARLAAELGPRPFAHFEPSVEAQPVEPEVSVPAASEPLTQAASDDVVAFAIKQQRRVVELTGELHRRQRRLDELEERVRELDPGQPSNSPGEQNEEIKRLLSEVKSSVAQMLGRQQASEKELREGEAVVEITRSLRQLISWTETSAESRDALRQLIAWTATTGDISKIAPLGDKVTQIGELLTLLQERSAEQRSAIDAQHAATLHKLDGLLQRQVIPIPAAKSVIVRNRYGLLAVQDNDPLAIGYYSSGELPERGTVEVVDAILKAGDCFVDVGANIGYYSLIAGRKVGPGGKVIAVEPTPSTTDALRLTLSLNGLTTSTEVHQCALGSSEGSGLLHCKHTSGHNSLLPVDADDSDVVEVAVRRGDTLVASIDPALVKIDVEGWELQALAGFERLMSRSENVVFIVEFSPEHVAREGLSAEEWIARVRAFGFEIWRISDQDAILEPLAATKQFDETFNVLLGKRLPPACVGMIAKPKGSG